MTLIRFALWNLGVRLCDVIGRPLDRLIGRIPFLRERTAACMLLHGISPRFGMVPESWWDWFGWSKP
jgi:hypothetical protein